MPHQKFFKELIKDHQEVKDILRELLDMTPSEGKDKFAQLKMEFLPHVEAEEKAFYKPLSEHQKAHMVALKGMEEHHVAEMVFKELEQMERDERWEVKLAVFETLVQEHIKEEESKVFAAARALSESQLDSIMKNFQKEKQKIRSEMKQPAGVRA